MIPPWNSIWLCRDPLLFASLTSKFPAHTPNTPGKGASNALSPNRLLFRPNKCSRTFSVMCVQRSPHSMQLDSSPRFAALPCLACQIGPHCLVQYTIVPVTLPLQGADEFDRHRFRECTFACVCCMCPPYHIHISCTSSGAYRCRRLMRRQSNGDGWLMTMIYNCYTS